MPLHIRVNSQGQTVKSAFVFSGHLEYSNTGDTLRFIAVNTDIMHRLIDNGHYWYIPSVARSISEIFSFEGQSGYDETLTVSSVPLSAPRGIGSPYEERYHGSISRGLLIFSSILAGRSFLAPSSTKEHPCEHNTYSGELIAKQVAVPVYPTNISFFGYTVETEDWWQRYVAICRVNSLKPLNVTALDAFTSEYAKYTNFELLIEHMLDQEFRMVQYWVGGTWTSTMSNVLFSKTQFGAEVSYSMDVTCDVGNQHYVWDANVYIPFRCVAPFRQPVVGNQYVIQFGDRLTFTYDFSVAGPWTGDMHQENQGTGDNLRSGPFLMTYPIPSAEAEHDQAYRAHLNILLNGPLGSFRKAVMDSWDDIVPSAMFSTVDAFKEAEGYLGTNVLQNLQKLPGIASSLPQVVEAVSVLGKIARRDLSFSTFKEILDLATSTVLQANFEWRPYHTIVVQYLPEMASSLSSLGDITKNSIGYGSFRHQISNDLGRKEVTLLTRTKLVMDASPSGLLSALLGYDALGLLPKASNLWDLIPFSFVANWFTGVGEALRRAEYTLLLAGIPAYFVHTYTITSPLTSEELDTFETSNSGDVAASLRLYYRDITLYSPVPRDSRFGFGLPSGFPPLGTFGSLLYQLIFS